MESKVRSHGIINFNKINKVTPVRTSATTKKINLQFLRYGMITLFKYIQTALLKSRDVLFDARSLMRARETITFEQEQRDHFSKCCTVRNTEITIMIIIRF